MDKKIIEALWNLPIKELENLIPNIKPLIDLNFKPSKKNLIREIEKKGIAFYIKQTKHRSQFINFFDRDKLSSHYGDFPKLSDQEYYKKIEKLSIQKHSEFFNFTLDKKKEKSKSQEIVKLEKPLYPYQNRVKKQIIDFLFSEKKQTLVQMPTGSGKTRTTMEAICDYLRNQSIDNKTSIVWFAYNSELCEQAVDSFQENWKKYGNQEMDVIRVWGNHNKKDIKINKNSFIVVSLDTAFNLIKTGNNQVFKLMKEIKENCSILICDEAHQSIAETYKAALNIFQNYKTKLIGLTATPGRRIDEEIQELINFYNGELIGLVDEKGNKYEKPLKTLTDDGYLSKIKQMELTSGVEINLTKRQSNSISSSGAIPNEILKELQKNIDRTLIISDKIKELVNQNKNTIVFATTKEHSNYLETYLEDEGIEAISITSDTSKERREESLDRFKNGDLKVLINFGVLTTGFDAPKVNAIIIARPTTSLVLYSQMIGRGMRGEKMGGTKNCDIFNVIDNILNLPNMNQAYKYFQDLYL